MTDHLHDLGGDPLLEATMTETAEGWTLSMLRPVAGSPDDVWPWLTEPDRLEQWSPIVPDRALTSLGAATTRENPADEPVDAEVLLVEHPHRLTHRWGSTVVGWTVDPAASHGSLVALRHGFGDREGIAMTAAGWHLCLAVLAADLSGAPVPRVVGIESMEHGWQALADRYTALLDD